MNAADRQAWGALPVILAAGVGIGWAGSQHGLILSTPVGDAPVFAMCAVLAFVLNLLVFLHAWSAQTERYYDLTGSLTYALVILLGLIATPTLDPHRLLLAAMVFIWAGRLGTFLFRRISRDGSDGRFDRIKPSFPRFLMAWTLQGLWVLITAGCGLAAITARQPGPLDGFAALGAALWLSGFGLEVLADTQKSRFRSQPANRGRFIDVGLWRWSRHPNYFGEILLWSGVAIVAYPALEGWQHLTLISPLFVYLLLTRVSGIPLLESRSQRRWGNEPAYQAYCARTPVLVPRPPRTRG
jgi:steroid 5-alpha reductase family enzyme